MSHMRIEYTSFLRTWARKIAQVIFAIWKVNEQKKKYA